MHKLLGDQVAQRIAELKRRLADLEERLPAHSVPAAMIMEMEEIEDELVRLQNESEKQGS
jgi:lipase chaperone LimK